MENDEVLPVPISEPGFKPKKRPYKKRAIKPYLHVRVDGKSYKTSGYRFENGFLVLNLLSTNTLYIRNESIKRIEVSGTNPTSAPVLTFGTSTATPNPAVISFNQSRNAALSAAMQLGDFGDQ